MSKVGKGGLSIDTKLKMMMIFVIIIFYLLMILFLLLRNQENIENLWETFWNNFFGEG